MTHAELVKIGVKWLSRKCSVVFYEFTTAAYESPDVIGWQMGFSILIECKVSRSDFLRDKHKPVRRNASTGMGSQRYYLAPPGIIKVEEIPEKWGLLVYEKRRVCVVKEAGGHPMRSCPSEIRFLVSMLRRAQIRIGTRPLSEWLRQDNMFEAKRGISPNAKP